MVFYMSTDARKYFDKIGVKTSQNKGESKTGQFETSFDAFWCCAQVGMHVEEYPALNEEKSQLVKRFAGIPKNLRLQILGLAFYEYCKYEGVIDSKKEIILEKMEDFFDKESELELGKEGYEFFNRAAEGGFLHINKHLSDINDKSQFLTKYKDLFKEEK